MKLSIITINLNKREGLDETLKSVREQTFRDFEQIVVDGGSTDGSLDVIRANESSIARWVSERDSGIYYAMNKGVVMASGDYLLFLNSGDRLSAPDVLEKLFCEDPNGAGLLYGHVRYKMPDGIWHVLPAPAQLTMHSIYAMRLCHQATCFQRELFTTLGPYDVSLHFAADFEYFLRCLAAGARTQFVDVAVADYEGGGLSEVNSKEAFKECDQLWDRYLGPSVIEDYKRIGRLETEVRRLKRAEDWIENAKRKPLWFNVALVCKWRWDRFFGKK